MIDNVFFLVKIPITPNMNKTVIQPHFQTFQSHSVHEMTILSRSIVIPDPALSKNPVKTLNNVKQIKQGRHDRNHSFIT